MRLQLFAAEPHFLGGMFTFGLRVLGGLNKYGDLAFKAGDEGIKAIDGLV